MVPALGLIFYLGPVAALLLGVACPVGAADRDILMVYALVMAPAALTVYLSVEYSDQWPVLQDIGVFVGRQMIIYDVGAALESHPGVFRVGEIAAWHAATAATFLDHSGDPQPVASLSHPGGAAGGGAGGRRGPSPGGARC